MSPWEPGQRLLGNLYIIILGTLTTFTWKSWEPCREPWRNLGWLEGTLREPWGNLGGTFWEPWGNPEEPWEPWGNLGNLYLGTFTWEPLLGNLYLGTFNWEPLLGNLGTFTWEPLLGTCSSKRYSSKICREVLLRQMLRIWCILWFQLDEKEKGTSLWSWMGFGCEMIDLLCRVVKRLTFSDAELSCARGVLLPCCLGLNVLFSVLLWTCPWRCSDMQWSRCRPCHHDIILFISCVWDVWFHAVRKECLSFLIPSWAAFVSCKNDTCERGLMLCRTILACRHFWVGTLKVRWRWIFVSLKYAVSVLSGTYVFFFCWDGCETLRWHWDDGFFHVKDRVNLKQLCAGSFKMSSFLLKEQLAWSYCCIF